MLRKLRVSRLVLLQCVTTGLLAAARGYAISSSPSSFLNQNPSASASLLSALQLAASASNPELRPPPPRAAASPSSRSSVQVSGGSAAASCSWLIAPSHPWLAVCPRRRVNDGLAAASGAAVSRSVAGRRPLSSDLTGQPEKRKKKMLAAGDGAGGEGLHWAPSKPTAALIFMHGLGDTASGWVEMLQVLEAAQLDSSTRLVLPTAPVRPVTLNMGMRMNAWSDIRGLTQDAREDKEGLLASKARIDALIDAEVQRGIDPARIIVGGFSQGGAMAYLVGLTSKHRLGGILSLSSWCPLGSEIEVSAHYAQNVPHILHCHGASDDLVRPVYGQTSVEGIRNRLLDAGAPPDLCQARISFKLYSGLGHSANHHELSDIGIFLTKVFAEGSSS